MKRRPKLPAMKQPTPAELLESCLSVVEAKFYAGHPVAFAKDKRRLLQWVIFYPASWLNARAVTIPTERYLDLFRKIILDAAANGNLGEIKYLPAWLAKVFQSHFAMHGDELYDEAKAMRNMVEHALVIVGKIAPATPDPVKAFTEAKRMLDIAKGKRQAIKPMRNDQLTFL